MSGLLRFQICDGQEEPVIVPAHDSVKEINVVLIY